MSLQSYIDQNSTKPFSAPKEIAERWRDRIVATGLNKKGAPGGEQYLSQYGKSIGEGKCINLARMAESENCADMAVVFWRKAYTLGGHPLLPSDNTVKLSGQKVTNSAAPAAALSFNITGTALANLPPELQPGKFSFMQPIDLPTGRPEYSLDAFFASPDWWATPKIDGEQCTTWAWPDYIALQSRGGNPRLIPDNAWSTVLKTVATKLGPAIFAAEEVYFSTDGMEYRTASEATEANRLLGKNVPPVAVLAIIKAVYTDIYGSLLEYGEQIRFDEAARYFKEIESIDTRHFKLAKPAKTEPEKRALYASQIAQGREGIVLNYADSAYIGGKQPFTKSACFRKKNGEPFHAIVTSLSASANKDYAFGAMVVDRIMPDGSRKLVGSIGSGFSKAKRAEIAERFHNGEEIYVVGRTQGWTVNGQLHHAVFEDTIDSTEATGVFDE